VLGNCQGAKNWRGGGHGKVASAGLGAGVRQAAGSRGCKHGVGAGVGKIAHLLFVPPSTSGLEG
jgi:hypothetical protein